MPLTIAATSCVSVPSSASQTPSRKSAYKFQVARVDGGSDGDGRGGGGRVVVVIVMVVAAVVMQRTKLLIAKSP